MSDTQQFHDIANEALAKSRISDSGASAAVVDAYEEASAALSSLLGVATEAEVKLGEHNGRRDLIPVTGWSRVRGELLEDATGMGESAQRSFKEARAKAETAILDDALPKIGTDREALARQEYLHALGGAKGDAVPKRLVGLARNGSPEVQAVLGTSFAKTDLLSREVANIDSVLIDARRVAAHSGSTPEGARAAQSLEKLKALDRAAVAANSAYSHALKV